MQLTIERDLERLHTRITSTRDAYDGYPRVDALFFTGAPLTLHSDRAATAAVLLFGRSISGLLSFNSGCSAQCAEAIRRFLSPIAVHVTSVNLVPSRIVESDRRLALDSSHSSCHLVFRVSDDGVGAYFSSSEVIITSNFAALDEPSTDRVVSLFGKVAAAVLFTEDLFVSEIALPLKRGDLTDAEATSYRRARTLLSASGLRLLLSNGEVI